MRTSEIEKQQGTETEQSLGAREFFTVSQLADLLQLTEMTIYRMVNRGELPCYAIGRIKRFRQRDIENFLESHRLPGETDDAGRAKRKIPEKK